MHCIKGNISLEMFTYLLIFVRHGFVVVCGRDLEHTHWKEDEASRYRDAFNRFCIQPHSGRRILIQNPNTCNFSSVIHYRYLFLNNQFDGWSQRNDTQ